MRVDAQPGLAGRLAWLVVCGCLVFSTYAGFRHVDGAVPYPEHIDEGYLMRPAGRVLQSETRDPKQYSYPSLPIYLDAAALAIGLIKASGDGPEHVRVRQLGSLDPPFYDHPQVHLVPRKLWVLLGVAALAAAAALAGQLAGAFGLLFSGALLTLVAVPTAHAWTYLGVDVPMATFAMLALYRACSDSDDDSYRHRVVEPALLCGAAMACKFTAFLLLLPCVLALWLFGQRRRGTRSCELIALSVLAFCVFCPRFLLDLDKFIDGIAFENFHYRVRGHSGFDVEPGWPQFARYTQDVVDTYGAAFTGLAVLGFVALFRRAPRRAAIVTSFLASWLLFLCSYKVHFTRNLLPVMLLIPAFAALGVKVTSRLLLLLLRRFARTRERAPLLAAGAAAVVVLACMPYGTAQDRFTHAFRRDSRIRFASWAERNLAPGSQLIVPTSLALSAQTLPKHVQSHFVDLRDAEAVHELAQPGMYILIPQWRQAFGGKKAALIATQNPGTEAIPAHDIVRDFEGDPGLPMQAKRVLRNPKFKLARLR
jgi:hypothetical protein